MPSTKGAGPGSPQLPLPSAPAFDRYGMHADSCECARCAAGYRPSKQARALARQAFERAQQREIEEQQAREAATPESKARTRAERSDERARETIETIRRMTRFGQSASSAAGCAMHSCLRQREPAGSTRYATTPGSRCGRSESRPMRKRQILRSFLAFSQ